MGILNFIFGRTTRIENEFFGTMLFFPNKKDPNKSYFECRRYFSPSSKIIEITIEGELTGPTQNQIDFFKNIEENYALIIRSIIPVIEDELRNWKDGFKIKDFSKEFVPVYIQLPTCLNKPFVWEIAFESDHDQNHTFSLTMSDFEAKEILIDG